MLGHATGVVAVPCQTYLSDAERCACSTGSAVYPYVDYSLADNTKQAGSWLSRCTNAFCTSTELPPTTITEGTHYWSNGSESSDYFSCTWTNGSGFTAATAYTPPANSPPTADTVTAHNVTQTNAGETSYTFTIDYSDTDGNFDIDTIDTANVTVNNGASVSNASYSGDASSGIATYTVTPPGGSWDDADNGTYTIAIVANQVADDVPAYVAADAMAGSFTVNMDTTGPTVTVEQAGGQSDPATSGPVNFTAIFSEPVSGFATGDVTLGGTSDATTGTVTEVAPNDGTTYNIAVSGMTQPGTVTASISGAVATDAAGNDNDASTSMDNSVTLPNPVIEFSQSTAYSSNEGVGTSNAVTLTSSGLTGGSSSVVVSITGGTATGGGTDYTSSGFPLTVNFMAGDTSKTVPVPIVDDTLYETATDETITFSIGSPSGATLGSQTTATLNIVENDSPPSVTLGLSNSPLAENGGVATLTATLSHKSVENVTANLGFTGTATGGGTDYTASAAGIQVAAGSLSNTATLTGDDDALDEDSETIIVDITSVTNGSENGTQQVTASITDDDATPTLSIDDVSLSEGNSGTSSFDFTVSLSAASALTVTVVYATADDTATTADGDYAAVAGTTLTFNPGDTSKTASVQVNGDTRHEANETFLVNLSSPSNATLSDGQGTGTINNDDAVPSLSIDDVNVGAEGDIAEFTVTLSAVSGQTVTVDAATADGSAEAGEDFGALATTMLTFNPGDTTQTVQVQTTDDSLEEGAETFTVQLSNPLNATIDDGEGTGTIPANDDDGVDGGTEGNVPGANGGTGDGNGDGIPDAEQGDVASIPTFDGEDWGTIEALDGHILTGVSAQAAPQPPAGVTFPNDMFSFEVTGVSAGETVRMSICVPHDPLITSYWKQDGAGEWHDIATGVRQVGNKTCVAFELTEGGAFDFDADPTTITDPGALGRTVVPSLVPIFGPWSAAALGLLLAGLGGWRLQRRIAE